jgi:hypothetical protein
VCTGRADVDVPLGTKLNLHSRAGRADGRSDSDSLQLKCVPYLPETAEATRARAAATGRGSRGAVILRSGSSRSAAA